MSKTIQITVGEIALLACLEENEVAEAIYAALPFELPYNTWGDEIYFTIPIKADCGDGQEIMEVGDLAYWPPGHAFCIFYGRTPASTDHCPRAASEVVLIGHVEGDATLLRQAKAEKIKIKRIDSQGEKS